MPPVIKSKRAQLTDEAVDWAKDFWKESYRRMKQNIQDAPIRAREQLEYDLAPAMNRIYTIFQNPVAMDEEITRLRALPYTLIEARDAAVPGVKEPIRYLVAHTKPVIIMDGGPYDMGPYTVYLPMDLLTRGTNSEHLHLVPDRAPETGCRHPHHVVRAGEHKIPWAVASQTCWGGFGSVMTRILRDGDLVDLLRNIMIYLTRYDAHSVLTQISNCPHAQQITRARAMEMIKNG